MVVSDAPVARAQLNPKCPRDLESIALKCLQKEPGKRYASAQNLAEDLRRYLAGEPIAARPISTTERLTKWAPRRPAAAALTVLAALVIGSLLASGLWFRQHQHH